MFNATPARDFLKRFSNDEGHDQLPDFKFKPTFVNAAKTLAFGASILFPGELAAQTQSTKPPAVISSLPASSPLTAPNVIPENIKIKSGAELISANNIGTVTKNGSVFEFYDLPIATETVTHVNIIDKLFSVEFNEYLPELRNAKAGATNENKIQDSPIDEYFSIWNIYREANNHFNYNREYVLLQKEVEIVKSTILNYRRTLSVIERRIAQNKKTIDHKLHEDKGRILTGIESLQSELRFKLDKIKELESFLKKDQMAERLMVMLSVINRNLSKSHKKTSAENVVSPGQYSWTRKVENKFPASTPGTYVKEMIGIKSLLEIEKLYADFVTGKTLIEAKTKILEKVSELTGIAISDLPTECVDYNTVSLLPDIYRNFDSKSKGVMGNNTLNRVGKQLDSVMGNGALILGSHVFVNGNSK